MKRVDWYFDYISPFSYLASASLARLPQGIELRPQPILFVGLLRHWQTRGPAEIEPMRRYTFRQISWLAERDDIALKFPPLHPFNPLKLLRLGIALDADIAMVQRLFRFVWAEGKSSDDPQQWQALLDELGVDDAQALLESPDVKARLRKNTENAIARAVFGVPSFVVDDEIFWGYDAIEFLNAYLADPGVLRRPGILAADAMPQGVGR